MLPMRASSYLRRLVVALVLLPALASVSAAAPQADPAVLTIERFHDVLLNAMKQSGTKDATARRLDLDPVMRQTFDFRRMVQIIVGPSVWRDASPETRDRLVSAFTNMSVSTYAAQFKGWNGESFETLSVDPGPRGVKLVRTRLLVPKGDPVALTYVMTPTTDGQWRVTDVLIKDLISELAVRRSDYSKSLTDKGLEFLIGRLEEQAKKLVENQP